MFDTQENELRSKVEQAVPDFSKAVLAAAKIDSTDNRILILHQDAFSADYDEYELLGMIVKYAGLYGVNISIIGKNRETL